MAKGTKAFIKNGELCLKCRNLATNPRSLNFFGSSCFSARTGTPERSILQSPQRPEPEDSSLRKSLLHSNDGVIDSAQVSEESKTLDIRAESTTPGVENASGIGQKIDLILESTLDIEKKQLIHIDSIRDGVQKLVVDLLRKFDDDKVEYIEALTKTTASQVAMAISELQNRITDPAQTISQLWQQEHRAQETEWTKILELRETEWTRRFELREAEWTRRFETREAFWSAKLGEIVDRSGQGFRESIQKLETQFEIQRQSWVKAHPPQGESNNTLMSQIELLTQKLDLTTESLAAASLNRSDAGNETYHAPPASPFYAPTPKMLKSAEPFLPEERARGRAASSGEGYPTPHGGSPSITEKKAHVDSNPPKSLPTVSRPASPFSTTSGLLPPTRPVSPFLQSSTISAPTRPVSPFLQSSTILAPGTISGVAGEVPSFRGTARPSSPFPSTPIRTESLASNDNPSSDNKVAPIVGGGQSRPSTPHADLESPTPRVGVAPTIEPPKARPPTIKIAVKPPTIKVGVRPPIPQPP